MLAVASPHLNKNGGVYMGSFIKAVKALILEDAEKLFNRMTRDIVNRIVRKVTSSF
jgi:hypothetical protein